MPTTEISMTFMGEDCLASVDYEITCRARDTHLPIGDPDRIDLDFEIDEIRIHRETEDGPGPAFKATGALFRVLAWKVDGDVYDHACDACGEGWL